MMTKIVTSNQKVVKKYLGKVFIPTLELKGSNRKVVMSQTSIIESSRAGDFHKSKPLFELKTFKDLPDWMKLYIQMHTNVYNISMSFIINNSVTLENCAGFKPNIKFFHNFIGNSKLVSTLKEYYVGSQGKFVFIKKRQPSKMIENYVEKFEIEMFNDKNCYKISRWEWEWITTIGIKL